MTDLIIYLLVREFFVKLKIFLKGNKGKSILWYKKNFKYYSKNYLKEEIICNYKKDKDE